MAAKSPSEEVHRPGLLKQQNKDHKNGRHRSKRELRNSCSGKTNIKTITKKTKAPLNKAQKRLLLKQSRKVHRSDTIARKRCIGQSESSPHVIAIVPLSRLVDINAACQLILDCDDSLLTSTLNDSNCTTCYSKRHRQKYTILKTDLSDISGLIDYVRLADSCIFICDPHSSVSDEGKFALSCIAQQGLQSFAVCLQNLDDIAVKKLQELKKRLALDIDKILPNVSRIFCLGVDANEAALLLRHVLCQKLVIPQYKHSRPYIFSEKLSYEKTGDLKGALRVTGYLRGKSLSANQLIHLPGCGNFQITAIYSSNQPLVDSNADARDVLIAKPDVGQETLVTEVEVDDMQTEQTWPTEEELNQSSKETRKKVPRGTSNYQAEWIGEDDDDEEDFSSDSANEEMMVNSGYDEEEDLANEEGTSNLETMSTVSFAVDSSKYDARMDMVEETAFYDKLLRERENETFPDEVDTPKHIPARIRFARYRGLQSFRTSPWDSKMNLPPEYARIFQFDNFKKTKKRVMQESGGDVDVGNYVTVVIDGVPEEYVDGLEPHRPLVVCGLLKYEQKMTVMHMLLKRHPTSNEPIKSKDQLIFQAGFLRFQAAPIYSQHTNCSKHKFERFFRGTQVATVYAPTLFPPSPILVFRAHDDSSINLVATGTAMSANPDRIIVKRIVLSGHPYKVNKKHVVTRYMFFNPEDINWFKPVELRTKYGRRGHIKESLGTHGHMKCVFDNQLNSQDTILMNLYKRVYPKWTYNANVKQLPLASSSPLVVDGQSSTISD